MHQCRSFVQYSEDQVMNGTRVRLRHRALDVERSPLDPASSAESGGGGPVVLLLAERGTSEDVYPVAKNNRRGSGSNKFCLVLV